MNLLACKEEEQLDVYVEPIDTLSAVTITGNGTLSFNFGSRVFSAVNHRGDTTVQASAFGEYYAPDGYLNITGIRRSPSGTSAISLVLRNVRGTGLYYQYENLGAARFDYAALQLDSFQTLQYFQTTVREDNYVHITMLDTIERIVSGTFEFETEQIGVGNIRVASQGRFDVRY